MENSTIVYGAFIIKYLIDMISPLIPQGKRWLIPRVALAFGLSRSMIFLDIELIDKIYQGVQLGAGAVGANEVVNTISTAMNQKKEKQFVTGIDERLQQIEQMSGERL